jgi:hypothetical protein
MIFRSLAQTSPTVFTTASLASWAKVLELSMDSRADVAMYFQFMVASFGWDQTLA